MGMDVHGQQPDSPAGEYFRANVWSWKPIADYCLRVAPRIVGKIQYLYSNDGDGLNGADSKRLAAILKGWCNYCQGKGSVRPWSTHYSFGLDHLQEFAEFLEHCGGFRIC